MSSEGLLTEDFASDNQVSQNEKEVTGLTLATKQVTEWAHSSIDRSDSGMEDESFHHSAGSDNNGDDDEGDEMFAIKRSKGKRRMIIDDDEDDADNSNNSENDGQEEEETDGDKEIILNDSKDLPKDHAEEDREEENSSTVVEEVDNKTGSEDVSQADKGGKIMDSQDEKAPGSQSSSALEVDNRADSDADDEDSPSLHFDFKASGLFDADSSDDDQEANSHVDEKDASNKSAEDDGSDHNDDGGDVDDDEGFDESQISPELLAKLKKMKGASKSEEERAKYSRKTKKSAEEKMLEIYSDSQRLVRDSRVNLPYYEPEPKSLDDFIARANRKRQEYAGLRRARDIQKAKICEKLSTTPLPSLPTPPRKLRHKSNTDTSQSLPATTSENHQDSSDCSQSQSGNADDSGVASQELATSQSSIVYLPSSSETLTAAADEVANREACGDEDDDLPELQPVSSETDVLLNLGISSNSHSVCDENTEPSSSSHVERGAECTNNDFQKDEPLLTVEDTNADIDKSVNNKQAEETSLPENISAPSSRQLVDNQEKDSVLFVPSLQKDPSRDLFQSQSTVGDENERLQHVFSQDYRNNHPSLNVEPTLTIVDTNSSTIEICAEASQDVETVIQETPRSSIMSVISTPSNSVVATTEAHTELSLEEQTPVQDNKLQVTRKLPYNLQGLDLSAPPRLSGTPDQVICLDEPTVSTVPKNPGVVKLMDRLARHAKSRTPRSARDVSLSIIEKEGEGDKKELKLKSVTYHVREEEAALSDSTPGSKLARLKQQLGVGMRKKREEGRQRRLQLYALENEEGFEGEKEEEKEEEEEAEMTDGSDTDDEEEEEEEDDYDLKFDESDDGKDYNPLLDMEADDDDDDDDENGDYDNDEEKNSDFEEDSEDVHLHFDVSDEENDQDDEEEEDDTVQKKKQQYYEADSEDEDDFTLTSIKKKRRSHVVQSDAEDGNNTGERSDDEIGELMKDVEKEHKAEDSLESSSMWSSDMTPMPKQVPVTQTQDHCRYRRENSRSPDLYSTGMGEESESNSGRNFDHLNDSMGYYNTQSQMLDADGFLKLTQTQKPPKSRIAALAQLPIEGSADGDDFGSSFKMTPGNIFHGGGSQAGAGHMNDEEENMRELMGLCSGTFGPKWGDDEDSLPSSQTRLKSTQEFEVRKSTPSDDSDAYDPFHILSDNEGDTDVSKKHKRIKMLSDSEDDEKDSEKENDDGDNTDRDADTDVEDEVVTQNSDKPDKFTGFKDKRKGIRKEFVEDEAELSGSEFDSDENLDLAEEDDILEEEAGDRDMAGVSEEKLRDEVGRMHMKQLQDEDDREVMRFKEMYLQDGDLYSEGGGRMRNFRWRDLDQNSQQDMFGQQSDEEVVEEDPEETRWRKDRFEREKFIEEADPNAKDESSQVLKMGQFFLKKKESNIPQSQEPTVKASVTEPQKPKVTRKGSFLTRSKEALVKIAQVAKTALGGSSAKASKNFVFQTMESQESQDENAAVPQPMQPPKRKAHSTNHSEQVAKRLKLSQTSSTTTAPPDRPLIRRQSSIFNLLEDK